MGNFTEGHRLKDLDLHGSIILKWFLEKQNGWCAVTINLAQAREQWPAVVDTGTKVCVP